MNYVTEQDLWANFSAIAAPFNTVVNRGAQIAGFASYLSARYLRRYTPKGMLAGLENEA